MLGQPVAVFGLSPCLVTTPPEVLCVDLSRGDAVTFLTLLGTLLGVIGAFLLVGDAGTLPYVISIAVISAFALCYKQKQYTKHY